MPALWSQSHPSFCVKSSDRGDWNGASRASPWASPEVPQDHKAQVIAQSWDQICPEFRGDNKLCELRKSTGFCVVSPHRIPAMPQSRLHTVGGL